MQLNGAYMNKKILIISNEPLSNISSNGRTLKNFLLDIPREQLAQFYLHGVPDDGACSSFFKVSDSDALNALLMRNKRADNASVKLQENGTKKDVKKNCRTMVIRDIVWRSYRWWNKDFNRFINDFAPDVILLQAGDAPFMYAIALRIAKKYKLPIIMYNSEEYVLKKWMYNSAKNTPLWHFLLQKRLKAVYKCFMKRVNFCIYNTEYLEEKYQVRYPHSGKSCALYTVSELEALPDKSKGKDFSLLYCGNLGVGRVDTLCEMAQVLHRIDSGAHLDIYGKIPDEESERKLYSNPNVRYGGVVPYDVIPGLMSKASMLIHCENAERLENLRGAFSTKIADSLASGRPFLVYATRDYPFVQYLEKYDCAHIAADIGELEDVLKKCISDSSFKDKYIENALSVAKEKHSIRKNCNCVVEILNAIEG